MSVHHLTAWIKLSDSVKKYNLTLYRSYSQQQKPFSKWSITKASYPYMLCMYSSCSHTWLLFICFKLIKIHGSKIIKINERKNSVRENIFCIHIPLRLWNTCHWTNKFCLWINCICKISQGIRKKSWLMLCHKHQKGSQWRKNTKNRYNILWEPSRAYNCSYFQASFKPRRETFHIFLDTWCKIGICTGCNDKTKDLQIYKKQKKQILIANMQLNWNYITI